MLNLPIHHIGIATSDIQRELGYFLPFGFVVEDEFIDYAQSVKGIFIVPKDENLPQYRFELVCDLQENGVLANYIKNKTKMYHIAYASKDLQGDLVRILESSGVDSKNKKNSPADSNNVDTSHSLSMTENTRHVKHCETSTPTTYNVDTSHSLSMTNQALVCGGGGII